MSDSITSNGFRPCFMRCLNDSVRELSLGTGAHFITNEEWLTESGIYWVEAGYGKGLNTVNPNRCPYNQSFFWADNRPNGGGFNIYCPEGLGSGDFGYNVQDSIWQNGNDASAWYVRITPHSSAQITAESTINSMQPNQIQMGEEDAADTSGDNAPASVFTSNYYMDVNKTWHYWHNPPFGFSTRSDNPPYANWENGADPNHNSTGGKFGVCTIGNNPCTY